MKYINPLDVAPKIKGGIGKGKAKENRLKIAKLIWS